MASSAKVKLARSKPVYFPLNTALVRGDHDTGRNTRRLTFKMKLGQKSAPPEAPLARYPPSFSEKHKFSSSFLRLGLKAAKRQKPHLDSDHVRWEPQGWSALTRQQEPRLLLQPQHTNRKQHVAGVSKCTTVVSRSGPQARFTKNGTHSTSKSTLKRKPTRLRYYN